MNYINAYYCEYQQLTLFKCYIKIAEHQYNLNFITFFGVFGIKSVIYCVYIHL